MKATNEKAITKPIATATAKAIKGSVQKINLVCRLINGMGAFNALSQLQFCKKRAARDLYVLLQSAISNAENNLSMDIDSLFVKEVLIGKSYTLRRFAPRARGRASRISKYYSRVTIKLAEKE